MFKMSLEIGLYDYICSCDHDIDIPNTREAKQMAGDLPDELNVAELSYKSEATTSSKKFEPCSPDTAEQLMDFTGLSDSVPRVAFEEGGRLVRPSVTG